MKEYRTEKHIDGKIELSTDDILDLIKHKLPKNVRDRDIEVIINEEHEDLTITIKYIEIVH